MSDPTDPVLGDLAKAGGGLGGGLLIGLVAWLRGDRSRTEERVEIREALAALRQSIEELRNAVQKSDKDLALIAHTLGEKSARNDRMEKRLDELEQRFVELELDFARSRGFDSGVRKSPSP